MFKGELKRVTLEAVVTHNDGSVENLGTIADSGDLTVKPGWFTRLFRRDDRRANLKLHR